MKSKRIESVISIAVRYDVRPSEVMGIKDDYTAFCFDEACCYIQNKLESLEEGEYPMYDEYKKEKHYGGFKEFYKTYGG